MDLALASRYPPYTPGKLKLLKLFTGSSIPGHSKPGGGNAVHKANGGLVAYILGATARGRILRIIAAILIVAFTRQGTTKL